MEAILNEEWTADVVGRMHRYKISNSRLAKECGYAPAYLSTVLNGTKHLSDQGKEKTRANIYQALEALEKRINQYEDADYDNTAAVTG